MTKKYVKERRERLQKLGERDAANRCVHCKRPMLARNVPTAVRFCSNDCRDAALDYIENWGKK